MEQRLRRWCRSGELFESARRLGAESGFVAEVEGESRCLVEAASMELLTREGAALVEASAALELKQFKGSQEVDHSSPIVRNSSTRS